jgi:hypothetical protein
LLDPPGGNPRDRGARGHVARDHGARADERALADHDAAEDDCSGADACPWRDDGVVQFEVGEQRPVASVARGRRSLMKSTPWPTNTSSPSSTPSQTNV